MKSFQKHVRTQCEHTGCRRNFAFNIYGSKAIAVQAAMQFEKITLAVLDEFDTLKRTPHQRKAMLDAHGLGVTYNKKSIAVQRTALARALSDCESQLVENDILTNVWKDLNNKEALDKSSIVHCKGGFAATFNGSQQKVEQIFKSLKAASDWVAQMNKADKDCEGWNTGSMVVTHIFTLSRVCQPVASHRVFHIIYMYIYKHTQLSIMILRVWIS